jgi:hypothetical protein
MLIGTEVNEMITNNNRPSLLVVSAMQIKAFMLLYKIIENTIIRANSVKCLSRRVGDDASPKASTSILRDEVWNQFVHRLPTIADASTSVNVMILQV